MNIRYVHTNIVARDWITLADFYCRALGCTKAPPARQLSGPWLEKGTGVINAKLEGIHLRLPGHGDDGPTLEIYQYQQSEPKSAPAANRLGIGHLAFHVESVESARSRILRHGGKDLGQLSRAEIAGVGEIVFIYMTDPEGNIIELQHWN